MASNIKVKFQVSGNELSAFLDEIQSKSDKLTDSAISGALEQVKSGKEVLQVVSDQITAIERKRKIENDAIEEIIKKKKEAALEELRNKTENEWKENTSKARAGEISWGEASRRNTKAAKDEEDGYSSIESEAVLSIASLKETEKNEKIQTQLSKETLDEIRVSADKNVRAIMSGDVKIVDVIKNASTSEEKLIAKLTEEGVAKEKKYQAKEGGGNFLTSLLGVDNFNKLIASSSQLSQTQNGFDMIQPASGMAGRIIGGIIGSIIGAISSGGVGTAAGAAGGSALGGAVAEFFGNKVSREMLTKQDYFKAAYRYNAITGQDSLGGEEINMAESGVSYTDFLRLRSDVAKRRGFANDSLNTTRDAIYLDKGFGVDQGTSGSLIEMLRSAKEGNRDLANLVGGILQKGNGGIFKNGDQSYLNEFLGKFISLQKDLLKTQTIVATGTTMDILSKFNAVGGEFASRDSRSSGNIQAIQESLSKPGSDNLKAASFGVMRKMMPNASIFDILKEREKGLGSPEYLKGILGFIEGLGGDESQQKLNIKGAFNGLSYAAVETLYKNRKGLMSGRISMDELRSSGIDFKGKSESNTNDVEKSAANIINGILEGRTFGAMTDAITSAINDGFNGVVVQMDPVTSKLKTISRPTLLQRNKAMKASKAKEIEENIIQRDNDVHTIGN